MEVSLFKLRLADGNVNIMAGWLLGGAREKVIDIAGGAPIDLILLGHVTRISGQVVLIVLYESFRGHF